MNDLSKPSSEHAAIVYDWHLDIRSGGPTGYLANLKAGLEAHGNVSVQFITRSTAARTPKTVPSLFSEGSDLVVFYDDHEDFRKNLAEQDARILQTSLENLHQAAFSDEVAAEVLSSKAKLFHVHTTGDCIKLHNLLTLHGRRHAVQIALTSHTPEIPAREWADVGYAVHENPALAEAVFDLHRLRDQLAFGFADVLIFPTPEALEPYWATWPSFDADMRHKPIYFIATGAEPLLPSALADPRAYFGVHDRFVLSFLGRHNSIKGYDLLCSAGLEFLEATPEATVLIAGKPEPMMPPVHERWIEIGWTNTPQDVIAACDVFVLPNRLTFFDLVVLEVLSAGRIILASNTGGNRSFAGRSPGIVLFDDRADFLEKLRWLADLPLQTRARMAQANRALYEAEYTAQAFAARYVALVDKIQADLAPVPIGSLSGKPAGSVEVSVVVPVYNVADYLAQCLDSILAQDFPSFEVIVVDDGSTDACPTILSTYGGDPRVRIVRQDNAGLSSARNTGLGYVAGRYVCFIDSDDMIQPDFLATLHQRCENDGTDIAFCAIEIFDAERTNAHSTLHDEDDFFRNNAATRRIRMCLDTASRMFPSAWNKLYRTSLFADLRYPRGYLYEDNPVHFALMLRQTEVSYVKTPLYLHRDDRPDRISRQSNFRMLEVGHIACLVYSIIRSETNRDIAREFGTRLLQRLFWERFWSVKDEGVNLALSATLIYLADLFGADAQEAAVWHDSRIESDFLANKRRFIEQCSSFTGSRLRLPLNKSIRVEQVSLHAAGGFAPKGDTVRLKEDGSILVHPIANGLSIAEITGLSFYGDMDFNIVAALENARAVSVEVRAIMLHERVLEADRLRRLFEGAPVAGHATEWIRLEAEDHGLLSLQTRNLGPCATLYVASRGAEGRTDFAWLHVRRIVAARSKPRRVIAFAHG